MRFRILPLLICLFLLSSCNGETEVYHLSSDAGERAWFFTGDTLVEVVMDGTEDLFPLFAVEAHSDAGIDSESYSLWLYCHECLDEVTGDGRYKGLASSSFAQNLLPLCGSFDEEGFAKRLEKVKTHYTYSLSTVIQQVAKEDLDTFLPLWLDGALR